MAPRLPHSLFDGIISIVHVRPIAWEADSQLLLEYHMLLLGLKIYDDDFTTFTRVVPRMERWASRMLQMPQTIAPRQNPVMNNGPCVRRELYLLGIIASTEPTHWT
jgi:hypothetical protein